MELFVGILIYLFFQLVIIQVGYAVGWFPKDEDRGHHAPSILQAFASRLKSRLDKPE